MTRFASMVLRIFLVPALLCPAAVRAQGKPAPDPDDTVMQAAVERVVSLLQTGEHLPRGPIGFDSRVLVARPAPESGAGALAWVLGENAHDGSIHALLGAQRVDFDRAVVCASDSPRSCSLPDVVAMFAATRPQVTASGAEVVVAARWRSDLAKMPVPLGRFVVTLAPSASGGWMAVDVRTLFIT